MENSYDSLEDFFLSINNKTNYLVLRNYEGFSSGVFLLDHPDIDILCDNSENFLLLIKSKSRTNNIKDTIHRKVIIGEKDVAVDIRSVGDGYYCSEWEREMLETKVLYNNLFYVLNTENYYYSLLYHAHFQKDVISNDYVTKLRMMGRSLGVSDKDSISLTTLEAYMRKKNYKFTYPIYPAGIAHFEKVEKGLIERNYIRIINRVLFNIKVNLIKLLLWVKK